MNEMVERVARALVDQLRADRERMRAHESLNYEQTDLWPDEDHMPPPNNGVYDGMIDAVALARAAFAAIRDLTKRWSMLLNSGRKKSVRVWRCLLRASSKK